MTKHLTAAIALTMASHPFSPEGSAQTTETTAPQIYASVYHANSWVEHQLEEVGIYRFGADSYARELVVNDPYLDASGGGAMTDDFYFCTAELNYGTWTEITHYAFDPETWTERMRLPDGDSKAVAMDLAYDPQTAKLFGCFNSDSGDGYVFGTLDVTNGERFKIADLPTPWLACSIDRYGRLYAIDMEGKLLAVDKVYGTLTTVAELGVEGNIRSTGAIDPQTNIFYFVVSSQEAVADPVAGYKRSFSDLWSVDLNADAPAATHRYTFADGEVMGGMWIPGAIAAEGAPQAPEGLNVTFADGALTGTMEFTVPQQTFGGTALTGEVSYLARANGNLLAEGKATPGEKVSVPATVREAGMYDITVVLSNAAGRSPRASQKMWIGHDMPEPITNVVLEYADGIFTLTWDAPTASQNGGYFDPAGITYTVRRLPDNKITENHTSTTFTDRVEMTAELATYSYVVTLNYDGKSLDPVSSNVWRLGAMSLPWSTNFVNEDALKLFTVIDVNEDRCEWYREWDWYIEDTDEVVQVAAYPYSSTKDADDWLITPPLEFKPGYTYALEFKAIAMRASDPEKISVSIGTSPTVEGMSRELIAPFEVTNTTPEITTKAEITVDTPNVYYIGFHACSERNRSGLALVSIKVGAPVSGIESTPIAPVATPEIKAVPGGISISATDNSDSIDYQITATDGRTVATGTAHGTAIVAAAPGLYIVKAGPATAKIAVR